MPALTLAPSARDAALLDDLVRAAGQSWDALVSEALRLLADAFIDDGMETPRLSAEEHRDFLNQLEESRHDPKVTSGRQRLEAIRPAWECAES